MGTENPEEPQGLTKSVLAKKKMASLSTYEPTGSKPLFVQSWNRGIVWAMLGDILGLFFVLPFAVDYFTASGVYTIGVVAFFAVYFLYISRRRLTAKVKMIKFYEGYFEMSGWRFRKQFTYGDISRFSLAEKRVGFFKEDRVTFTIKDEPTVFQFTNPKNKELRQDLFSWAARKVDSSALQRARNSIF